MTLFSFLSILCFSSALLMAAVVLNLNRRAALNQAVALLLLALCLEALGTTFTVEAPDDRDLRLWFRLSSVGTILYQFCLVLVTVFLVEASRRWVWYLLLPLALVSAAPWPLVDFLRRAAITGAYLTLLIRETIVPPSRRCRRIGLFYLAAFFVCDALRWVSTAAVGWSWEYPDPSPLVGLIVVGVCFHLIFQYQHMMPRHTLVERELLSAFREGVLLLGPDSRIVRANPAASRFLGSRSESLTGNSFGRWFHDEEAIHQSWTALVEAGNPQYDLECSVGGRELLLDLLPARNALGDLVGGVAILREANFLQLANRKYGLTPRESEVFELLVQGYENSQIADELFIAPATVKIHVHHIYEKTGATTRIELYRRLLKAPSRALG